MLSTAGQLPFLGLYLGKLFEQFIGLELIRRAHLETPTFQIRYWRSHGDPEVDYIIERNSKYTPIEVKWIDTPTTKDCRHLELFLNEYSQATEGYIVCHTPRKLLLKPNILAIPWQELNYILHPNQTVTASI